MRKPQSARAEAFRRMIIGLCAGGASDEGLAAAAELAAQMGLEIEGLFIEDEAVLGLSGLPFLREIEAGSLASRPFSAARLESQMRLAAGARQKALAEAARRSRAAFRFQAVRGEIEAVVSRTAGATDLMVVIEPGGAAERLSHAAVTLRRAALRSHASVLYVPAPVRRRSGAIAVVLQAEADQSETLWLAARVAAESGNDLVALSADADEADRKSIVDFAAEAGLGPERVRLVKLVDRTPGALAHALESIAQRLIVLDRGALGLDDEVALTALATRLRVPVLTVEPRKKGADA